MDIEKIITWGTFLLSVLAMTIALRKSKAEVHNLDADTIGDLQNSLNQSIRDYSDLCDKIKELRREVDRIRNENEKLMVVVRNLEIHIRALVEQLLKAGITPVTMEQALDEWRKKNV